MIIRRFINLVRITALFAGVGALRLMAAPNGLQDVGTATFTDGGVNVTSAEYILSASGALDKDATGTFITGATNGTATITVTPNGTTVGSFELTAIALQEFITSGVWDVHLTGNVLGGGTVGSIANKITGTGAADTYAAILHASFSGVQLTSFTVTFTFANSNNENLSLRSFTTANSLAPAAALTSATYDAATGALVVTGTNFVATGGAANDVVANKFTFTGQGGATFTLNNTPNVEISSATAFTLTLSAADRAAVNALLNKNGASSTGGTAYNLAGAAGFVAAFASGADAAATIDVSNVDSTPPTISAVSIPNAAMKIGSTVTATITVTSDTDDYTTGSGGISGNIGGFTLGSLSRTNATTYTATFTVTSGGTDVAAGSTIPLSVTLTDSAGNASTAFTTAINQASDPIDANRPVISAVSIPNAAMKIGDTVTATITVTSDTDNYTTGSGGISGNIGGFTLGSLSRTNATTYTATFTVTSGGTNVAAGSTIPLSVTLTDSAGNASTAFTTAINQASDPIDANRPVISAVSIPNAAMKVGDTVTATITVTSDTDNYTTGSGGISGNIGGFTLGSLSRTNATTYTATFTVTSGGTDVAAGSTIPLSVTLTDSAGNASTAFTTAINQASDPIDANRPVISAVSIPNAAMKIGDTVTATITVTSDTDNYTTGSGGISGNIGGFTLGSLSRTNATTYTATFTVTAGGTDVAAGSDIPLSVTLTDSAGNASTAFTTAISQAGDPIDAHAPTATIATAAFSADTGTSSTDFITMTAAQTISGTVSASMVAGEIVEVSIDNGGSWTTATTTDGLDTWSLAGVTLTASNTLKVRVADTAGNVGATFSQAYVLDTTAPSTPTAVALTPVGGTVVGNALNGTNTNLTATATVTAGQATGGKAELYVGATLIATDATVLGGDITVTFDLGTATTTDLQLAVAAGGTATVKLYDLAGNNATSSVANPTLVIDYVAPTATIATAAFSADTGTSSTDFITMTAAQTISGTVSASMVAGEIVEVSIDNGGSWTTATTTDGLDTWSLAGVTLTASNTLQVRVADTAGNSGTTFSQIYVFDTTDPTAPTAVALAPVGGTVVADILNATNTNLTATATITAGQATGGAAELYIGATLIATDSSIAGGDTSVTFDVGTATTGALQAAVTASGVATVKLYDLAGNSTTSSVANPTLTVDYTAPTVVDGNISISGASGTGGAFKIGDTVTAAWNNTAGGDNNTDVASVTLNFTQFGGGAAVAAGNSSDTWTATFLIAAGAIDATNRNVSVTATDNAGNATTTADATNATVDNQAPSAPTAVALTPVGGTIVANTLNGTNTNLTAAATVTAGQATGGTAELYIGATLIAADNSIAGGDSTVTFDVGTATTGALQAAVTAGGVATVKLYDAAGNSATSAVANPTLAVDYTAPSAPTAVALTSVGGTVVANTLNGSNTNLTAAATITAGQATGGKAELYIGATLIASDSSIAGGDTSVTFDVGTATTGALQAAVTAGGVATVKLYDAASNSTTSAVANPTLVVDYTAPSAPTAVALTPVGGTVVANTLNGSNTNLTATATITAGQATGGTAELYIGATLIATDSSIAGGDSSVTFDVGTATTGALQAAVTAGGVATVKLYDAAGNSATSSVANPTLVVDYTAPNAPTAVALTPVGGSVVANALNGTNTNLTAAATITAGQATGGKAELYIGATLIATDSSIAGGDTSVTFDVGTATTGALQAAVTAGGVATVRLYDAASNSTTSAVANPTLVVDYTAPGAPTAVALTPVGGTIVANTLNGTNTNLTATATITAGQATGGKAELYIGATLVATDSSIAGGDTSVALDVGTATTGALQAAVTAGGVATVKLYDAAGNSATSSVSNPTLVVDYVAPTTTVATATFSADTGTSSTDFITNTAAQTISGTLSATIVAGEIVEVSLDNGSTWATATTNVGQDTWSLSGQTLTASDTLKVRVVDAAANSGAVFSQAYVLDTTAPNAPTAVALTPVGGTVVGNSLNGTNTNLTASATVTAGQATGGKAELYVGATLIATDSSIAGGDTSVTFDVGTATTGALQAAVTAGGVATVKLYDLADNSTTSSVANPTLTVDYTAPSAPTAVALTPVGGSVVTDTLNGTNTNLNASATISAGEATGGKAELYVGATLIATDNSIAGGDTSVSFDVGTATTGALQAAVTAGGVASVKLYDAAGNSTTSSVANPTLIVDYTSPTAPTAVALTPVGGNVVADTLNATNTNLTATATITAGQATGGTAELYIGATLIATDSTIAGGDTSVTFDIGASTTLGLQAAVTAGGVATVKVYDTAGNVTTSAVGNPTLVVDYTAPTAPAAVALTPVGGSVVANTLNATNTNLTATATITAGQATGGTAELYIDAVLIATDNTIGAGDATVTFDVGTATNGALQIAVPAGGIATVQLHDTAGNTTTSSVGNPTLIVTYSPPSAPTAVTLTPVGGTIVANTLNGTNTNLTASATIVAGQATGGMAELYIGATLIATDNTIGAGDTALSFDLGTSTTVGLQAAVVAGGVATVKLSDSSANISTSAVGNPTLVIDYGVPTFGSIAREVPTTVNTAATSVTWRVTFGEDVTGVDASDFALTAVSGSPTGTIGVVTPVSASIYDVTVGSLGGQGRLRLDLKASGTNIQDVAGNALAAGGFTTGDFYYVGVTSVFDTLSLATGTTRTVSGTTTDKVAQRFTTAAASPLSITTVIAALGAVTGTPTPVVTIYTDVANAPGVQVVTALTNPASLAPNALNTWTSTTLLTANTTYWVVFADTSGAGAYEINETAATSGGSGTWLNAGDYIYYHGANAATGPQVGALQLALGATSIPTITSTLAAGASYGSGFSYQIAATNLPTSFTASGLPNGLTLAPATGAITGAPTQSGAFNVTLTATNGSGTSTPATLVVTVAKASLTITANSVTRGFGQDNPALSVSYAGFVNSESPVVLSSPAVVSTTATATSPLGTYPITVSGAAASNYNIGFVAGVLTVGAGPQTISFTIRGSVSAGETVTLSATASSGLPVTFSLVSGPATISGANVTLTGTGTVTVRASQAGNASYAAATSVDRSFWAEVAPPAAVTPPVAGGTTTITAPTAGAGSTYQWQRNGDDLTGATNPTLTLNDVQPPTAGLYTYTATIPGGGGGTSDPVIVGITTEEKVIGTGELVGLDIVHPNGNTYDQVLLEGPAATVTASQSKVTRISFIDLTNDIVQVELSGAGTLSVVMDDASTPAPAVNYNQSGVDYVRGHAGLVITGANETTNISVFSVGPVTAVNQALFQAGTTYDGVADLAFIAIQSTNGKFGGIRTGNTHYFATTGFTGVYAPGVEFAGPVNIGDVNAFDSATPVLVFGSAGDVQLTGGSLFQTNGQPVTVSGITKVRFVAGTTSQGTALPAQANQGVLVENGIDVTAQLVVNP